MGKYIYALGIGHNTPVFIELAEACGYTVKGLYHYNANRTDQIDHGLRIIGSFEDLFSKGALDGMDFLLTMGDNEIRTSLSERIIKLGGHVPTLIHPTAIVSRFSTISDIGVYISPFSYIQADSTIGNNTVILSGVNISHTNKIGNSCFIAGGATIGAYTIVEDFVFIGQGALSISKKVPRIGQHSYIGARSLLTHEVPPFSVVAGSPAKIIKTLKDG